MDPQLEKLIKDEAPFFEVEDSGKIKCTLNNHSFVARFDVISAFVNGTKYKSMKRKADANDFGKWDPFIVPSKNKPGYLFCALTCRLIERDMAALKRHLDGKKFQRAKARYLEQEDGDLMEEPTLEGSEEAVAGAGAEEGDDEEGGIWVPEGALESDGDDMAMEDEDGAKEADKSKEEEDGEMGDDGEDFWEDEEEEEEEEEEAAPVRKGKGGAKAAPGAGKGTKKQPPAAKKEKAVAGKKNAQAQAAAEPVTGKKRAAASQKPAAKKDVAAKPKKAKK